MSRAAQAAALAAGLLLAASASAGTVRPWPLPSDDQAAAQPSLATTGAGGVYLSWIARGEHGVHRLQFARADRQGRFGPTQAIAAGNTWFVNWADFPGLLVHGDHQLASFVLVKSAALPYAYDLALLRSDDGGASWSAPQVVHDDGTATEHGFAALWPEPGGRLGVAWLDGRHTGGGHGHGGGAMSLRAAVFGDAGKQREWALDGATCDCCQTDAARTDTGVVLVYRDRAPGEIRDIALLRKADGADRWSEPALVHADDWMMPACPVNGPAVAAQGQRVAVAWYTAAGQRPRVQLALSADGGATFAAPQVLAEGPEVLGRVDVQFAGDAVLASWLEEQGRGQRLLLARLDGGTLAREPVATLAARGRASGFPRLAVQGDSAFLVWTDVADGVPRLRGARIALPGATP